MSDATFLDNQEVTAEDLNNIAIDLGYPDYSHFPEETPPSAVAALNQITADLVTSGVLLTGNRCAVTYADGIIYVDTGIIVFESGAKKRIESIQQLQALEGTSCVYALNDTINNTISLVCASEFPTEGDFVKLASVTSGKITDSRIYSTAKVDLPTLNYYEEYPEEFDIKRDRKDVQEYVLKKTLVFGSDKFNLIAFQEYNSDHSNVGYLTYVQSFTSEINVNAAVSGISFEKEGNTVKIYALSSTSYLGTSATHSFKKVIVM
ncbi:MAG: hypothetical protein IJ300_14150 [Clostridia bacterium]|nr:hypothetical protein [Clostridia bacterium]